ncbi:hypothetical protein ACQEU3_37335 [Spirillospora sp. CA-253888]
MQDRPVSDVVTASFSPCAADADGGAPGPPLPNAPLGRRTAEGADDAPRARRVVLKVGGSAAFPSGIDRLARIAESIRLMSTGGTGVVVAVAGDGVFSHGEAAVRIGRAQADAAGMAATGVNALVLQGLLEAAGVETEVFSRGPCAAIGNHYSGARIDHALRHGRVAILAGGMGVAGFSADLPAVHAAIDVGADMVILLGGAARPPSESTVSELLVRGPRVLDSSTLTLALNFGKRICMISASHVEGVLRAVRGEPVGSVIHPR